LIWAKREFEWVDYSSSHDRLKKLLMANPAQYRQFIMVGVRTSNDPSRRVYYIGLPSSVFLTLFDGFEVVSEIELPKRIDCVLLADTTTEEFRSRFLMNDDDDGKPIRYHLTRDYALDRDDRVFIDRLEPGTINWFRFSEAPTSQRHPVELEALLRDIANREGGESWRAMTDRGELLRVFSVSESAFLPTA
jgi:hypothetical protein